jgi:aminoglycoside phosphotransferase family enzyme
LETPIDGVLRVEKSGRRTRKLDEDKATEIIEQQGIADDVYKMVRVIDEDALMAAYYEGKITEEQIDEMFPTTVVWALRVPKK